jgi:SAM-dependent methyltransferase
LEVEQYRLLYESEDTHWWFVGQRAIMDLWLEPAWTALGAGDRAPEILDVGCGTGGQAQHMAARGRVTAVDFSPLALGYSRRRGLRQLARAGALALPFPDAHFDLVSSLDVIYHRAITDDAAAVREAARVLRPGGYLFLRVGAYNWLYSEHDRQVHTARRYTRASLAALASRAGLVVRRHSYANSLLLPLIVVYQLIPRVLGVRGDQQEVALPSPRVNALLTRVLLAERRWLRHGSAPYGASVLCLAQKPPV